MKKIMFNDKYGLTSAVLEGRKTMTRRIITDEMAIQSLNEQEFMHQLCLDERWVKKYSRYQIGEVVAIAQNYQEAINEFNRLGDTSGWGNLIANTENGCAGYYNKMFVKADLMPHRIRITDIKVERLHDISVRDCMREGIEDIHLPRLYPTGNHAYTFDGCTEGQIFGEINGFASPLAAFAALIDKVSGRGTWDKNQWVFAYTFELVK